MQTTLEWSLGFDQMWNNIMSNQAPGLTEHDKSFYLTAGQEDLIRDTFSRRTDPAGEGFDGSEFKQADFLTLIKTKSQSLGLSGYGFTGDFPSGVANSSVHRAIYPSDVLVLLNEEVHDASDKVYQVVPISYQEYKRLMSKPYKYPPKGQAWRLDVGMVKAVAPETTEAVESRVVNIIARITTTSKDSGTYNLRYVKKPDPIVLPDELDGNTAELPIEGVTVATTCKLPVHLHQAILRRAVMLAKIAWSDPAALQQRTNG